MRNFVWILMVAMSAEVLAAAPAKKQPAAPKLPAKIIVSEKIAVPKETPPEPKPSPEAVAKAEELVVKAKQSLEKGDQEEALKFAQEASSLNAYSEQAQDLRAELAMGLKKNDEAVDAYRKLLKVAPKRDDARKRLGNVLMRSQRYAEAVAEYDVILKSAPDEVAVRYNMARCQALSDQPKEALASLKLCIEQKAQYRQTATGDPAFETLKPHPEFQSLIGQ